MSIFKLLLHFNLGSLFWSVILLSIVFANVTNSEEIEVYVFLNKSDLSACFLN